MTNNIYEKPFEELTEAEIHQIMQERPDIVELIDYAETLSDSERKWFVNIISSLADVLKYSDENEEEIQIHIDNREYLSEGQLLFDRGWTANMINELLPLPVALVRDEYELVRYWDINDITDCEESEEFKDWEEPEQH